MRDFISRLLALDWLGLDWMDIILHVLGAVAAVGLVTRLGLLGPGAAVIINAAVWFVREGVQQNRKGKPLSPLTWSLQKHAEWIAPALAPPVFLLLY